MTEAVKAKHLRLQCKRHIDKQPCRICGKHQIIAEQHHLISLKECSEILTRWPNSSISVPLIWLCPNCHTYVHWASKELDKGGMFISFYEALNTTDIESSEHLLVLLQKRKDLLYGIVDKQYKD